MNRRFIWSVNRRFLWIAAVELVVIIILWQILANFKLIPAYLESPAEIGRQFWLMILSGELFANSSVSLYRSLIGFVLVAIVGVTLGIAAGYFPRIGMLINPIMAFMNPVPKIALLPLLLVWFGVSDTTRVLIIFLTAFFPCFIATYDGVKGVKQEFIWAAANMGANTWQIVRKIVFPASLPKIFDGLRVSLALTFVMMFSSEMIGSSSGLGLGFLILSADVYGRTDLMFVGIISIGILGFLFDLILSRVRKSVVWWSKS